LRQSLEKLRVWISARTYSVELIVVNDCSSDSSLEILEQFRDKLDYYKIISLPQNRGKGFAVRAGMKSAKGACVVFTDTDLSYGAEIFDEMYKFMKANQKISLLYGSRAHPQSQGYSGYTKTRRLSSLLFSNLVRFAVLPDVKDTQCGVKMFRKNFSELASEKLTVDRFAFDIELFVIARAHGLTYQDFPVALKHREETSVRLIRDAIAMFKDIFRIKINARLGRYK